jgi:hypothetical protein
LGSHNKKTLVALVAAAAIDNSFGVVASMAHWPWHSLSEQRPAYTSVNGYTIFLATLQARCEVCLPLPFRFIDMMGGDMLTHAIMEECSSGLPSYPIEIFHDGKGKSYLRGGWPQFVEDYDLKLGWSLIFPPTMGHTPSTSCHRQLLLRPRLLCLGVSGRHL